MYIECNVVCTDDSTLLQCCQYWFALAVEPTPAPLAPMSPALARALAAVLPRRDS